VQSGCRRCCYFSDDFYRAAGAEVVGDAAQLWARSDIVFKVARAEAPKKSALSARAEP